MRGGLIAVTVAATVLVLPAGIAGAVPPPVIAGLAVAVASPPTGSVPPSSATECGNDGSSLGETRSIELPKLPRSLVDGLALYARDVGPSASVMRWYDSGGPFGGGVPAAAVRSLMRAGLAGGLRTDQVASFLDPKLLRGIADPFGGGGILAYIVTKADPELLAELAAFATSSGRVPESLRDAQGALFAAFPELVVVYQSLAGATPIDETGAVEMVELADAGYGPAQRTIERILAAGNHPRAGAQNSGGVPDGVRPDVYDAFVAGYHGPLSSDARLAVANRQAYQAWVERIAAWTSSGSSSDAVPAIPTFDVDTRDPAASPTDLSRTDGCGGSMP
jgi:hypothetical protein